MKIPKKVYEALPVGKLSDDSIDKLIGIYNAIVEDYEATKNIRYICTMAHCLYGFDSDDLRLEIEKILGGSCTVNSYNKHISTWAWRGSDPHRTKAQRALRLAWIEKLVNYNGYDLVDE